MWLFYFIFIDFLNALLADYIIVVIFLANRLPSTNSLGARHMVFSAKGASMTPSVGLGIFQMQEIICNFVRPSKYINRVLLLFLLRNPQGYMWLVEKQLCQNFRNNTVVSMFRWRLHSKKVTSFIPEPVENFFSLNILKLLPVQDMYLILKILKMYLK